MDQSGGEAQHNQTESTGPQPFRGEAWSPEPRPVERFGSPGSHAAAAHVGPSPGETPAAHGALASRESGGQPPSLGPRGMASSVTRHAQITGPRDFKYLSCGI